MKARWSLTMALAKHYLGEFTGVMYATGVKPKKVATLRNRNPEDRATALYLPWEYECK